MVEVTADTGAIDGLSMWLVLVWGLQRSIIQFGDSARLRLLGAALVLHLPT